MPELTSHERFSRMYEHKEADRVPVIDSPWPSTIERWQREGLAAGPDAYVEHFGLDRLEWLIFDDSPRYPAEVVEETAEYKIYTTGWGVTMKQWNHIASTPEYLDFKIVDRKSWKDAKLRLAPSRDRVYWDRLKDNYRGWRKRGAWIGAQFWFGFDITHSWIVGTERFLMALIEDPEWCREMFETQLDLNIATFNMLWDEGYEFDFISWPDDMGFKGSQFFSVEMYREILKPVHKRAIDWAHGKRIYAHLHSCGDIRPFVPELIDIGLDALNPLEVKAGVDPVELKKNFGDKLVFHGGTNAVLYDKPAELEKEMRRVIPEMKKGGGYIWSTDHSVPDTVSLDDFGRIVKLAKELGTY